MTYTPRLSAVHKLYGKFRKRLCKISDSKRFSDGSSDGFSNGFSNGFSLVELLVVIAIMVILIALLTPNIIGYVKKARKVAALSDAQNMVNGTQTALIYQAAYRSLTVDKKGKLNGQSVTLGGISNTSLRNAISHNLKTNAADTDTANSVIEMIVAGAIDPGNAKSGSGSTKPFGQNCATWTKGIQAEYGILCLYNSKGGVVFMQIYHDGILVTYANGLYVANDSSTAKFIGRNQSFSQAFLDAGQSSDEIPDFIKNSSIQGW